MILRRIAQHMKQQHWTGVLIELVIVVLAVFIGLQVDNWNQARHDRASERVCLQALARDLDTMAKPPTRERQARLAAMLSRLARRGTLKLESATFQELQSSGHLGLIRDPVLRGQIVMFFSQALFVESVIDQNNKTFIDNGFTRFLISHGVAFSLEDAMHKGETPAIASGTRFDLLMRSHYGERLPLADSAVLASPPSASFWSQLRVQLDWRTSVAAYDEAIGMRMQAETGELKEDISAYLDATSG